MNTKLIVIAALLLMVIAATASAAAREMVSIISAEPGSPLETLAAKEVRRYLYLRTGQGLPMVETERGRARAAGGVVVGRKDRSVLEPFAGDAKLKAAIAALGPQQYLLKTVEHKDHKYVLIVGGDEVGTLYGAYRFAERLGVRFYLHGDVVPDEQMPLELPALDETARPLFELRGIQPFHDFPEGPDWWNLNDYKAILSQLPKLGMNFIGLHTYPEGGVGPEPTVWIGTTDDADAQGAVRFSCPARHFTTLNGTWGYQPKNTGDYNLGMAALFGRDAYGAEYMKGKSPWPGDPKACNELFNQFGGVLRGAFRHAHALGIKTCVGTETPLTVPKEVKQRLQAAGKDPADRAVVQALYEGIFTRIKRAYPIDYYWFWTPENWTWQGATDEQVAKTLDDLKAAIAAAKQVDAKFALATCGWVLGPPQDRALFDTALPKDMPVSCINRQVGKEAVDPGFARIAGRGKWVIPWLEDDPSLTSPQLWVGRMRRDAFDARRYGCTGLMGIHWRTRILGPNVAALAKAGWDQTGWSEAATSQVASPCKEGAVGGKTAAYPNSAIAGTEDDPLYQTVRYDLSAYHIAVPNGKYSVTLKFCEPHYGAVGQRVFGVEIQGQRVLHKLDIFEKAGKNKGLDFIYKDVKVDNGRLNIEFTPRIEYPCVAAIVVEGGGVTRKINCGGPAYKDYEADLPVCPAPPRHLPSADFYADWAASEFGPKAGPKAAAIFARLDGQLPEPSTWVNGPGGIQPDHRPWAQAAADYAFVDEFAAVEPLVEGPGARERFDYWLSNFRYMRAIAQLKCTWGRYDQAMQKVEAEKNADAKRQLARETALPIRKEIIQRLGDVYGYLIATIKTTGEMGTLANWEQHIQPMLLTEPGKKLEGVLGEPLPADMLAPSTLPAGTLPADTLPATTLPASTQPARIYGGPPRLVVPTVRASLTEGEPLELEVIILTPGFVTQPTFMWRPIGAPSFTRALLTSKGRRTYAITLGPDKIGKSDFEYYVEMTVDTGQTLRFPATAPRMNQTVVIAPPSN